mgnify:CR=1 FL=1
MPELTYRAAVRQALAEAMRADDDVFLMGEDIAEMGGSMGVTQGLYDEFGAERVDVLQDLSLEIPEGDFLALMGPSGSGKTTLLSLIAGLTMPTAGRIFIGGRDVTQATAQERNIGLVFQSYALFPHMSVEKNVGYGLKHETMSREEKAARVREIATQAGRDDFLIVTPGVRPAGSAQDDQARAASPASGRSLRSSRRLGGQTGL